jgi:uncharacterized protein YrrD
MNDNAMRKWSGMNSLAVTVPSEGRVVGIAKDYYFKEGTNAIYSVRVRTRLLGDYSLPVIAIKTIEADKITINNANMLIKALPYLPQIQSLQGRKVIDENEHEVGIVSDVLLDTSSPTALRIAALEIAPPKGANGNRVKSFTADAVVSYDNEVIMIQDQVARRLR